jgi:predicted nucleic acid-binding protein
MKYWDSSAIVPLLFEEDRTHAVIAVHAADPAQIVWCLTDVEIASALARRLRDGIAADRADSVRTEFKRYADRWSAVNSVELVRSRALRLVNTHPLRAADALQLAAALVACDDRPESLSFVCLDDRLRDAARREGFKVLPS